MMNCYLASANKHKAAEIQKALAHYRDIDICLKTAESVGGMPVVEETEDTFSGNALLKAKALAKQVSVGDFVLADDSGLQVDALDGQPGVRTARYAGEHASDAENNAKLLQALQGIEKPGRGARFVCCFIFCQLQADGQLDIREFNGICDGQIADRLRGTEGFGYDPLFIPDEYTQTMAELGEAVKSVISHRARAVYLLAMHLRG